MSYQKLFEIAQARRSIRKFKTDPVSREDIEKMVAVGTLAPSGANLQPWEVVVVDDPALKDQVSEYLLEGIGDFKTAKGFVRAPAFILLYGDDRLRQFGPPARRDNDAWWNFTLNTSLANAFMSMQLAATSLGLGTQWVSAFRNPKVDQKTKKLLGIPDHLTIYEMMAVGYFDIKTAPKKLRPLSNVIHYNRADNYRADEDLKKG